MDASVRLRCSVSGHTLCLPAPFSALPSYVDAELLNALLLRRDCCSVSAAKVGGVLAAPAMRAQFTA